MASLFEKIVAGEIPSHRLYDDKLVYAFLDVGPISRGHALVIPKVWYATLDQVPPDTAAALGRTLPMLTRAVIAATGTSGCNVLQNNGGVAGQAIDHVHFHIIPKYEDGAGLRFQWDPGELKDGESLAESIRDRLAAEL